VIFGGEGKFLALLAAVLLYGAAFVLLAAGFLLWLVRGLLWFAGFLLLFIKFLLVPAKFCGNFTDIDTNVLFSCDIWLNRA